eukprot:COSAG06_NODE_1820_length_8291_cov_14.479858_1_plen_72_part_00
MHHSSSLAVTARLRPHPKLPENPTSIVKLMTSSPAHGANFLASLPGGTKGEKDIEGLMQRLRMDGGTDDDG